MGWKDWSYWIKGGIIGLIIGVISVLVKVLLSSMWIDDSGRAGIYSISSNFIFYQIFSCLVFLIVGSLIGWIYGKNKKY